MKKINLFNEIIVVERSRLMQAINSNRTFGIAYDGQVVYEPGKEVLVFKGKIEPVGVSALMPQKPKTLSEMLGGDYQIVEDEERILIKAARAWQSVIALNIRNASYDDTTNDGLSEFHDKELEEIGWHADEFNIKYHDIAEAIEAKCDGVLLYIEQDDPYQFSGLGFIFDDDCARTTAFEYAKTRIAKLVAEEEEYSPKNMTDDEEEAARFFGVL